MGKWILNASPLIFLGRLEQIGLVEKLCDEVIVPRDVADEITAGPAEDQARRWIEGSGSSFIKPVPFLPPPVAAWDLGKGESAVLALGYLDRKKEIVVDDRAARNCAKALEIKFLGTLSVILRAKKLGHIKKASPLLRRLVDQGYRIDQHTFDRAVQLAGEG
ncbi:MAG: DUF3368 domain-containing protein [Pseudomonadota bacterium]